ncbi:MAG: hypothetical protein ACLQJR_13170 [Stellaceae bacterium]
MAIETARGWRIAKEKASHKIDVVVALAQAALGAVLQGRQCVEFGYQGAPRRDALFSKGGSLDRLNGDGQAIAGPGGPPGCACSPDPRSVEPARGVVEVVMRRFPPLLRGPHRRAFFFS